MTRPSSSPSTPSLTTTVSTAAQNKNAHSGIPRHHRQYAPADPVVDLRRRNADARGRGFPLPCLAYVEVYDTEHMNVFSEPVFSQGYSSKTLGETATVRVNVSGLNKVYVCLADYGRNERSSRSMPRPASSSNPRSLSILRAMARSPSLATPARNWTSLSRTRSAATPSPPSQKRLSSSTRPSAAPRLAARSAPSARVPLLAAHR